MPRLSEFKITKKAVDALVADRDALYFDAELRGFAIRTKPSGTKTYLVQYQDADGRTRRVTIGQYGALTPADAREQAADLLGRVRKGENPSVDRVLERRAVTMKQLCESYLEAAEAGMILGKRGLPKKASTLYIDRGRIMRHIIPLLGARKVKDLTTPDMIRFMRDVAAGKTACDEKTRARGRAIVEGGAGTAARTVGLLGGILSFAVGEGVIRVNPARGVRRPADNKREVRLGDAQYRALGGAVRAAEAAGEAWQAITAVRLLTLTGCRRGEIERLRWTEVDLPGQCLRLVDSKTGKSIRPLGGAAIDILKVLPRSSEFVLPGHASGKPFSGLPKAWKRVLGFALKQAEGRCPDDQAVAEGLQTLTPHGLRHAFASVAADLGLMEITIAALLGHRSGSTTSRYIHHLDPVLISAADRVATTIAGTFMAARD